MSFILNLTHFNIGGGKNRNPIHIKLLNYIQGYNHTKYWHRRSIVIDPHSKAPLILRLYYLIWIKKTDAKHLSSFGTNLGSGAQFASPPELPHGPNGIICGHDAKIGKNCRIFQQVTIAHGNVRIGDHTEIGAGAKILPGVTIGNHCHIGANAIVVENVPDYATCVLTKPRIIIKSKEK